jgi:hypothetical protein
MGGGVGEVKEREREKKESVDSIGDLKLKGRL